MVDTAAAPAGAEISGRIARRVRALRAELGITLDTLAAKSDVSRSMLSLVERGESSATAVVLAKIATGLGVSLAALFDDRGDDADSPPAPLSRGAERATWRDPESGYLRRNVSPAGFGAPFQIVDVVLPPGARVAYDNGARDVVIQQQVWVREGSVEVTVGATAYRLAADDCLAMRLDEPTAFRNRTRKPARYVVVVGAERPQRRR